MSKQKLVAFENIYNTDKATISYYFGHVYMNPGWVVTAQVFDWKKVDPGWRPDPVSEGVPSPRGEIPSDLARPP